MGVGLPAVRLTIGKAEKLRFKAQFDRMRSEGVRQVGRLMLVVALPADQLKGAVVCGRKFSLLAVERNRARRLLWESFRLLRPLISPSWVLLVPRRGIRGRSRPEVTRELAELLVRHRLLDPAALESLPEC